MDIQRFRSLSPKQRALVAFAVLLDGREAGTYLERDSVNGPGLKRASGELSALDPELRMALAGTLLRAALREMGGRSGG